MTKEDFFIIVEENILKNDKRVLCAGLHYCQYCPIQKKCPFNRLSYVEINQIILKEYEKYKTEILTENLND